MMRGVGVALRLVAFVWNHHASAFMQPAPCDRFQRAAGRGTALRATAQAKLEQALRGHEDKLQFFRARVAALETELAEAKAAEASELKALERTKSQLATEARAAQARDDRSEKKKTRRDEA